MTDLLAAMAESWPPEAVLPFGPWTLRRAPGAGNRVTCATAAGLVTAADITSLAEAQRGQGQTPTVMLRDAEGALDSLLAAQGWRMGEEVVLYHAPLTAFAPPAVMTAFPLWPPLGVMRLIWEEDGTGPAKQRVMDRAPDPKTAILGRTGDRAAGAAFVTIVRGVAFLHALAVSPALRRQGTARNILCAAATWARETGATSLALAVTRGNAGARSLYASLGMEVVGQYHYRIL